MVVSVLVSLLVVAAPIPKGWSTYANERFGYSIGVPAGLKGQGESGNGDGQEFQSASGNVSLKVWASPVVAIEGDPKGKTDLYWNHRAAIARWKTEGVRVTSNPESSKGWWTLSGEDAKGRVHYMKQLEKDGVVYGFEWSHPKGAKAWRDATDAIVESFKLP
ncbi:hypothetical protein [Hyalangium versicolor]|uniref:hypothetical protein n=1 Tax=Hyalangium versicolor TaxID=2861190 RepID=UPI001CC97E71|nr:hypothetical protein [Hyalangium versicolor]